MPKNKNFTANEIIKQIQILSSFFWESRYISFDIAYDDVEEDPSQSITMEDEFQSFYNHSIPVIRNFEIKDKDIGYYLRQNYLIRLFSLLQFYGAYDDFDNRKHLTGYTELKILKDLRNRFGHTYGVYDRKDRKLTKTIVKHFNLPKSDYKAIPLPVDSVIHRIEEKSFHYIKELSLEESQPKIPFFSKYIYLPIKFFLICFKICRTKFKEKFFGKKPT